MSSFLSLIFVAGVILGIAVLSGSKSAVHETVGMLSMLVAVVALAGAGIISKLEELIKHFKGEEIKAETAAPEKK
jgi:hypothetical protein